MRKLLAAISAFVATIVLAATYGPFPISSFALRQQVSGNYAADEGANFGLASAYFTSVLQTMPNRYKPSDRIRILYNDGVVAEFSLKAAGAIYDPFRRVWMWSPTPPLEFKKVVKTAQEQASYDLDPAWYCGTTSSSMTVWTGYWGQDTVFGSGGAVTITAMWISTGPVTVYTKVQCV